MLIGAAFLVVIMSENKCMAQRNRLEAGVETGPGFTFLFGNDAASFNKPALGYLGGFFGQYNSKGIMSLKAAILFEKKETKVSAFFTDDMGNPVGWATSYSNYNYITLPILARITFEKRVPFFVNAGPYFACLLSQKNTIKGDIPTAIVDNTNKFNRFDMGIVAGFGVSVPLNTACGLSFELRNNTGAKNISALPIINNGTLKTNSTYLLFGFVYKLKGNGFAGSSNP